MFLNRVLSRTWSFSSCSLGFLQRDTKGEKKKVWTINFLLKARPLRSRGEPLLNGWSSTWEMEICAPLPPLCTWKVQKPEHKHTRTFQLFLVRSFPILGVYCHWSESRISLTQTVKRVTFKDWSSFWISYTRGPFSVIFSTIRFDESFAVLSRQTFSLRPPNPKCGRDRRTGPGWNLTPLVLYDRGNKKKGVGQIWLCNQAFLR